MPQPDYLRSMIINALLQDYHALTPDLKFLRRVRQKSETTHYSPAVMLDEMPGVESSRHRATGWFNRVAQLYRAGLLTAADLSLIASPRAAQLWRDHVLPLDRAVREAAQGTPPEGAVHPVEHFWCEYAEGRLVSYNVSPELLN